MYNFRTDLASERRDIYQKANDLKMINQILQNVQNADVMNLFQKQI